MWLLDSQAGMAAQAIQFKKELDKSAIRFVELMLLGTGLIGCLSNTARKGRHLLRLRETIHGFLRFTGLVFFALAAFLFSPKFSYSQEIVQSAGSLSDTAAPMAPQPPTNVIVKDLPNDGGGAIIVRWNLSPDDDGNGNVTGYIVSRAESADGPFKPVGDAVRGAVDLTDNQTDDSKAYYYRVDAFLEYLDAAGEKARLISIASPVGPIKSTAQWFNLDRKWALIFLVFVAASIIYFIEKAKKGGKIYVRKIAGIDAVDEAVGRAPTTLKVSPQRGKKRSAV